MIQKLRVADFFSGAGGFSEGFRMAGFEIVFALDNWRNARETHKLNHSNCNHPGLDSHFGTKGNILLINENDIDEIVPDVEVIVGSPPCVSFSSSNRAGNADKSLGLTLIKKFLQIIAIKKHKKDSILKYWFMENVTNSINHIKDKYTFSDLNINSDILKYYKIKKSPSDVALIINKDNNIFNSVFYGVPQKRKRFICGEFIQPNQITPDKDDWIKLGFIINSLKTKNLLIKDPIYDFKIKSEDLTDHYYNTIIPKFEWEETRIKKQQARYYGKMAFPENPDNPSRTIMATRSILAREAMILPNGSPDNFRAPTIREAATIMSFPITYLFQADNEASKYRLVGNAVCPKLAFAFAKKIMEVENGISINKPLIHKSNTNKLIVNLRKTPPPKKVARDKHIQANFAEIVPDLKINNFRVELDNNLPRNNKKRVIWSASIHHATGKDSMKYIKINNKNLSPLFKQIKNKENLTLFKKDICEKLKQKIPNSKKFQEQHYKSISDNSFFTPREAMSFVKQKTDKHFPEKTYFKTFLSNINVNTKKKILRFNKGHIPNELIPLRIIVAAYGIFVITELTKKGVVDLNY